jgi:hypothetical protein
MHDFDDFIGRSHCMRKETIVDDRRLIAITPHRVPRSSRRIPYNSNLKSLLQKMAEVRFDAHVR